MKTKRIMDVHTEHCCARHGCKYGMLARTPCTVTTGARLWQSYPCEVCEFEIAEVWEIAHLKNQIWNMNEEMSYVRPIVVVACMGSEKWQSSMAHVVDRYNEWVQKRS